MACVKADAYGHNIALASTALNDAVDGYAVACMEEAQSLRDLAVDKPILMLEGPQTAEEVDEAIRRELTLCIHDWHQLDWLRNHAAEQSIACWIKIDTGMHRLGFPPTAVPKVLAALMEIPHKVS